MLKSIAHRFDHFMRQYTPDPFLIAALLTLIVFGLGVGATESSPKEMVLYWGDGFWGIITFTLQMVMVLVGGYIVACSPPIRALLAKLTSIAKTSGQAILLCSVISCLGCWFNWGFGLIVAGFTCREMASHLPNVNYRVLVASSYSGFLVWHGGLSGSIPLLLATPGNFSEELMGRTVPVEETIFSPLNLAASIGLLLILPTLNYFMGRGNGNHEEGSFIPEKEPESEKFQPETPAEHLENSFWVTLIIVGFAASFVYFQWADNQFQLDLNRLNFLFLFLGMLFHGRPRYFLNAVMEAGHKVGPLLLQYPFYGGIMGMMQASGLAVVLSELFVSVSTTQTFNLLTFYSAGLVNLFVPSGGGQWAVQSNIIIPAAQSMGVDVTKAAMAVAWGDSWTNMAQPFWALPLLAIAGLKIRDIMGYCLAILAVSGLFLSAVFLLF